MKKQKRQFTKDRVDGDVSLQASKAFATPVSVKVNHVLTLIQVGLAIMVAILIVYWQVGSHEFINYDDNQYIYENPHVTQGITGPNIAWSFTSVEAANWHPITWLSHMADVQLYGMNPRGHHFTNVFIHTAATVLLLLLLFRLSGSLWQSAFVAALFALHPMHVESVAWVAERKDVLSAFFWFLTLILYAAYVAKRKLSLYLLTLFSFVLGLMAKPMLVTLPVVMLLLDYWPLKREFLKEHQTGQSLDRLSPLMILLKEKIPFFVCTLLSAAITLYAQHDGGAMAHGLPFGLRVENAATAYVTYLVKVFWPHDLAVLYPLPDAFPLWQVIGSVLILLLVSTVAIWARRRHPYLTVGWFWFLITLVPVIGLVQVGSQSMADRYTYIPYIGLFIMAAWGVPVLAKNLPYRRNLLALLAGSAVMASAIVTWYQLGYWQNSVTLFRHAIQVTPNNYIAHLNLGGAIDTKGDLHEAIKEFREAIPLKPKDPLGHFNLGIALKKAGDVDAAIKEFRESLAIKPNDFEAHASLGESLYKKGELDAAINEYWAALAINPKSFEVHTNLAVCLAGKGDLNTAIKEFRKALAINPDSILARENLETALSKQNLVNIQNSFSPSH